METLSRYQFPLRGVAYSSKSAEEAPGIGGKAG